jgi:single-stranded DNA-binding protein
LPTSSNPIAIDGAAIPQARAMSLFVLAAGSLIADPQCREGAKGQFATAAIRADDNIVNLIAFGSEAERLLGLEKGAALAASGRARLTSWKGRDGTDRHGISIVAEQIAAAKPRAKSAPSPMQRRAFRARRSSYSSSRLDSGPSLPADRVDDLWDESRQ